MSDQNKAEEKMQLARLKLEHDDFHAAIDAMLKCNCNSLQIQRMKKKKLETKDKIRKLQDGIIPDIIA